MNVWDRGIAAIKANQTENGAYIASPSFPTYHFSWFRDGSYIAYAMDLAGERASAQRFFDWAIWTVGSRRESTLRAIEAGRAGKTPGAADLLDTRYTVDGEPGEMQWFNNQLDGFGTLLWAIEQHTSLGAANAPDQWRPVIELLADYLSALWMQPCSDCWEEFPDKIHIPTLAAIFGGLSAAARMLGRPEYEAEASKIRAFVLRHGVSGGALIKFVGSTWVDASLVHVCYPYCLLEANDPIMRATIARLEDELLVPGGGIHRYVEDNYYGGGEWILLTAYLGCYYVELGDLAKARDLLNWIEAQADDELNLPEQVEGHLLKPERLAGWIVQWGPPANPLLWSHAAQITLRSRLGAAETLFR